MVLVICIINPDKWHEQSHIWVANIARLLNDRFPRRNLSYAEIQSIYKICLPNLWMRWEIWVCLPILCLRPVDRCSIDIGKLLFAFSGDKFLLHNLYTFPSFLCAPVTLSYAPYKHTRVCHIYAWQGVMECNAQATSCSSSTASSTTDRGSGEVVVKYNPYKPTISRMGSKWKLAYALAR